MEKIVRYRAYDGTEFGSEYDCIQHERALRATQIKGVEFYRAVDFNKDTVIITNWTDLCNKIADFTIIDIDVHNLTKLYLQSFCIWIPNIIAALELSRWADEQDFVGEFHTGWNFPVNCGAGDVGISFVDESYFNPNSLFECIEDFRAPTFEEYVNTMTKLHCEHTKHLEGKGGN